jgi:hypothetical protein
VAEVDEAWLRHIAIGVGVVAILLDVATMIAEGALLQQFAAVGKMSSLITPVASIQYSPVIGDPRLANKPLPL